MARIAIIDDDRDIRDIMTRVLEKEGHEVFEAENGADGFKVAHDIGVELVITDLAMPEKNGIELIAKLKRFGLSMPVLAVTGEGRPVTVGLDLARRHGATGVLGKPFTPSMLREAVELALSGEAQKQHTAQSQNDKEDDGVYFIVPPNLIKQKVGQKADDSAS